jgi:hypothetical protein
MVAVVWWVAVDTAHTSGSGAWFIGRVVESGDAHTDGSSSVAQSTETTLTFYFMLA